MRKAALSRPGRLFRLGQLALLAEEPLLVQNKSGHGDVCASERCHLEPCSQMGTAARVAGPALEGPYLVKRMSRISSTRSGGFLLKSSTFAKSDISVLQSFYV